MLISDIINPILLQSLNWERILLDIDNSRVVPSGDKSELSIRFEEDIPEDLKGRAYEETIDALHVINDLSPEREIVERFVSKISFVFDGEEKVSSSNSSRNTPGHIVITNPFAQFDDRLFIMESIVHESIHCILIELEHQRGWLCSLDDSNRIVSPWTGRALIGHSFVHAVIVYHALARTYAKLIEREKLNQGSSAMSSRLFQIVSGFLVPIQFGLQIPCENAQQREVASAITRIQNAYKDGIYFG